MKWKEYERPDGKYSLCVNTTDTFIIYKHLYIYIYMPNRNMHRKLTTRGWGFEMLISLSQIPFAGIISSLSYSKSKHGKGQIDIKRVSHFFSKVHPFEHWAVEWCIILGNLFYCLNFFMLYLDISFSKVLWNWSIHLKHKFWYNLSKHRNWTIVCKSNIMNTHI